MDAAMRTSSSRSRRQARKLGLLGLFASALSPAGKIVLASGAAAVLLGGVVASVRYSVAPESASTLAPGVRFGTQPVERRLPAASPARPLMLEQPDSGMRVMLAEHDPTDPRGLLDELDLASPAATGPAVQTTPARQKPRFRHPRGTPPVPHGAGDPSATGPTSPGKPDTPLAGQPSTPSSPAGTGPTAGPETPPVIAALREPDPIPPTPDVTADPPSDAPGSVPDDLPPLPPGGQGMPDSSAPLPDGQNPAGLLPPFIPGHDTLGDKVAETARTSSIPEPSALALMVLGLLTLAGMRSSRRDSKT
jgi:hypothetical protein